MLEKIGAMLGFAQMSKCQAESMMMSGGDDGAYRSPMTREEAAKKRKARKAQKAAKKARRRNRR